MDQPPSPNCKKTLVRSLSTRAERRVRMNLHSIIVNAPPPIQNFAFSWGDFS